MFSSDRFLAVFICFCSILSATPGLQPGHLKCEYAENPMGVQVEQPLLSWVLRSAQPGQQQSAYQILVASSPELLATAKADLWNSGQVLSDQSVHIPYAGATLSSRQHCYWSVRVWDQNKRPSAWSSPAQWEMALLHSTDWQAYWIGSGPTRDPRPASGFFKSVQEEKNQPDTVQVDGRSSLLRKSFAIERKIKSARLYVTGLGYYEVYCNGQRIGDHVLAPAKSNYRRWVLYDVYDITKLVQQGHNAIGLMLGNGWFNPYKKWWQPYRMQWFGNKRAIAQLCIDYSDGSSQTLISDDSWKTSPGPVLFSCTYDGEGYDATLELPGWCNAEFDDTGWQNARHMEPPGGALICTPMPSITVAEHVTPVRILQPKTGIYIYDLGQNFAGWIRLSCRGKRGQKITLRYAEDLHGDGTLDVTSNENALATDTYVLKGEGKETYEPHFTFHGFQFVEITGLSYAPTLQDVTGCVVHSACQASGSFACSNDLVNRIHRATLWSQRSNLMGYPMDCPQRDERLGWLGDAMVTAEEAMLNFDTANFFRQWLDGLQRNQNPDNGDISIVSPRPYMTDEPDPVWSSAYILINWQYYVHFGDTRFLQKHFASMCRFEDYLTTQAQDHLLPKYWIGDWGTIVQSWQEGDPPFIASAFYYHNAMIIAKAAAVLHRSAEEQHYAALAGQIKQALNNKFFDTHKQQYDQGSQFSNALPLCFGLVAEEDREAVLKNILNDLDQHQGHFTVGVLGAKYLIDALTTNGRSDRAYALVNQTGFPSWSHLIDGRTTLSEFWNLKGSHNHVMLGSIDSWFYNTLAGIRPDEARPGFKHIIIQPYIPESLQYVKATVQTLYGPVKIAWQKEQKTLTLQVSIPHNTTATVTLPGFAQTDRKAAVEALKPVSTAREQSVFALKAGSHTIVTRLP
jgi:alpha-L-rhamnosidase